MGAVAAPSTAVYYIVNFLTNTIVLANYDNPSDVKTPARGKREFLQKE